MDNLRAIRSINLNRADYFRLKNLSKQEHNPVLLNNYKSPPLNRAGILEVIQYIAQKYPFSILDALSAISPPPKTPLNLVLVTCLYHHPQIWRMILSIMATYPIKKIVAVWSDHDDEVEITQFRKELPAEMVSKFHFIYHEHSPLNQKWQRGVLEASQFQPEAVLLNEANHFITFNYIKLVMQKIHDEGFELVGTRTWMDIFINEEGSDYVKLCQFNDYRLKGEFIFSGRMVSTQFLQRMKWQIFYNPTPIDHNLEKISNVNLLKANPKIYEVVNGGVFSMRDHESEKGLSTYDSAVPGNSWLMEMINKTRHIDYMVSKDIYVSCSSSLN